MRSEPSFRRPAGVLCACVAFVACGSRADEPSLTASTELPPTARASTSLESQTARFRASLDGRAFPRGVLALTYDDGPDAYTLELAEYLSRKKIAATFFVVGAWVPGVSSDPGQGDGVFATGVESLPVLEDLHELGQRIANHTENHVLLWDQKPDVVRAQLATVERRIDPFIDDEVTFFRAPGGAWNAADADVVASDATLSSLVGPVRWDIDRKDWEGSLSCDSNHPRSECEPAGPGGAMRVKPQVMAQRYLSSIEAADRGIVLFHTRLGHVGSRYSVALAEAVIPELEARGYVFAAPVLRFSAPRIRFPSEPEDTQTFDTENVKSIALGDIDGDGRSDMCAADGDGVVCAFSVRATGDHDLSMTRFAKAFHVDIDASGGILLADVDGDGLADLCAASAARMSCALSTGNGFGKRLPPDLRNAASMTSGLRNVDLNGDGRVDRCAQVGKAVSCAFSKGTALTEWTTWSDDAGGGRELTSPLVAGDINGDGRSDICGATADGIVCGVAP